MPFKDKNHPTRWDVNTLLNWIAFDVPDCPDSSLLAECPAVLLPLAERRRRVEKAISELVARLASGAIVPAWVNPPLPISRSIDSPEPAEYFSENKDAIAEDMLRRMMGVISLGEAPPIARLRFDRAAVLATWTPTEAANPVHPAMAEARRAEIKAGHEALERIAAGTKIRPSLGLRPADPQSPADLTPEAPEAPTGAAEPEAPSKANERKAETAARNTHLVNLALAAPTDHPDWFKSPTPLTQDAFSRRLAGIYNAGREGGEMNIDPKTVKRILSYPKPRGLSAGWLDRLEADAAKK